MRGLYSEVVLFDPDIEEWLWSEPGTPMPSKTERQRKAMAAACYGKSTLGIPKTVGCEFAKHDAAKKSPRFKKGHGR